MRGSRKKLTQRIDVAMIQTLANLENPRAFFRDYGAVIIDECHHVPAVTLEALLKKCSCCFITGLTATPQRKDRLEQLLFQQCGPIRHFLKSERAAQRASPPHHHLHPHRRRRKAPAFAFDLAETHRRHRAQRADCFGHSHRGPTKARSDRSLRSQRSAGNPSR